MQQMLAELGNPHQIGKFIHIAGTNGKGTVAAMLSSIFVNAGYKTGLYTSPHLVDVRERIRLNGKDIEARDMTRLLTFIKPTIEKYNATYFETLTALAFLYFTEQEADIVVLETGLGGRLDATNVVDPILSIITTIDFDHTEHLGKTLADIAREKAGIIKPQRPCLIGDLEPSAETKIIDYAKENYSPVYKTFDIIKATIELEELGRTTFKTLYGDGKENTFDMPLNGAFQVKNACIALAACEILKNSDIVIETDALKKGIENVLWPGRFQVLQRHPLIIADVAHNVASIEQLLLMLAQFCPDKKFIFVFGVLKDKDYIEIAKRVGAIAHAIQPVDLPTERALSARELQSVLQRYNSNIFPPQSVTKGLRNVLSVLDNDTVVCITGSHYIVGTVLNQTKVLTK